MADEDGRPAITAAGAGRQQERAAREAAALRANLRKRKAQQRGRGDAAVAQPATPSGDLAGGAPDGGDCGKGEP